MRHTSHAHALPTGSRVVGDEPLRKGLSLQVISEVLVIERTKSKLTDGIDDDVLE